VAPLYTFGRYTVVPLVKGLWRPWTEGLSNIPADGPAILASNHLSVADSIFLPALAPREIVFLAKAEYFVGGGVKGWVTSTFMRGMRQIPVDRGNGRAALTALEVALSVLKDGGLFGIYPEGTRSPDGRLYRGKTGVARMALESGVPVIPVAMVGTFEVQPPGRLIWRRLPVKVVIGKPLDFSRYEGLAGDRFVERSMTDEIMYELMIMSGREYVDLYAAKVKADKSRGAGIGEPGAEPPEVREAGDRAPVTRAG
jgi:1-acyl-sn-glycerol-3-phosphate acyltransferase